MSPRTAVRFRQPVPFLFGAAVMSKHKQRRSLRKKARLKRAAVIALYGRRCFYCSVELVEGEPNGSPVQFTLDHVRALSRGGTNDIENLRPACPGCNQARGNGDPLPGPVKIKAPNPPRPPSAFDLSYGCEDEQGRRELRLARAARLGVTDARFLPNSKSC